MSWKKYGGIDKYEKMNHIKANSIVTDTIVVKESFLSDFVVDGTMTVNEETFLRSSVDIGGLTTMRNNLDVSGNLILSGRLFLSDNITFIQGSSGKIGFNVIEPTSTFDVASINQVNTLNVYTNTIQNRNILARNNIDNGLAFFVDGTNSSSIQFYNKAASYDGSGALLQNGVTSDNTGLSSHAKIEYSNTNDRRLLKISGTLLDETELLTKLTIANRNVSHDFEETVAIYDSESFDLYPNINTYSGAKYGNALTLFGNNVTNDITSLYLQTHDKGLYFGGGRYPVDTAKAMGIIDLRHSNNQTIPAQIIVDGSGNYAKTLGFNTYAPNLDNVVNINGPLYVSNDNIEIVYTASNEIINYIVNPSYPNISIACGLRYYALYTYNGGKNWNIGNTITPLQNAELTIYDGKIIDASNSIVTSYSGGFVFYSTNGGINYTQIQNIPSGIYCGMHIYDNYVYYANNSQIVYFEFDWSSPTDSPYINFDVNIDNYSNVYKVEAFDNTFYVLKSTSIDKYTINPSAYNELILVTSYSIINTNTSTLELKVFNANVVIAKSYTSIHGTTNGGTNWNVTNLSSLSTSVNSTNIKRIYLYDEQRAVVVGNSFIIYSVDGFKTWKMVTENMLNSSGLSYLLHNKNLSSIYMPNANDFYFSVFENNEAKITKLFSPSVLNFHYEPVLETIGSIKSKGDVMINDGQLRSTNSTFDLLPDSHNIINIGADANFVNVGKSTGDVTIPNNTHMTNAFTTNFEASGNSTIHNLVITDSLLLNLGEIDSSSSNFDILPSSHNTINIGLDTNSINIGKSTGDVVINNNTHMTNAFTTDFEASGNSVIHNLRVDDSLLINTGQIDSSNTDFNLLPTSHNNINIGTDASFVNIGKSTGDVVINNNTHMTNTFTTNFEASGNSTMNNSIINNVRIDDSLLINTGQIHSSNTDFNLLPTSHNNINIGSDASFINIGKSTSEVTINNNTHMTNTFTTNFEASGNSAMNNSTINSASISDLVVTNSLSANSGQMNSSSTNFNLLTSSHDSINFATNTSTLNIGNDVIHIGDGVSDIYFDGRIKGDFIVDGSFTVQTNIEQEGDLELGGDLFVRKIFSSEVYTATLDVSENSILNDVSATNLTVTNTSNMNELTVIDITTNDLSTNNLTVHSSSVFKDDVMIDASLIVVDGSFNDAYINQLISSNANIENADISLVAVNMLTVNHDANIENLDVSNNTTLNNLIVENDSSFNNNVHITGNASINGSATVNGNININNGSSLTASDIKSANTSIFNLLSTGTVSHNRLNIGTDVSYIKLGGEFTTIEYPRSGTATTSTRTSSLNVEENIYFGYPEGATVPQYGSKFAVFNGSIVVFNSTTLNDVSASSIKVTTLDSTTSYLSDKLYFGYRSDDSNIPSIPSNTAYFKGSVEVSGNTVLHDASSSTLQITDNLYFGYGALDSLPATNAQTAVFNGDLVVLNASTMNDVSASSIDVTTLDSTTTYLSDKLYFGYRSDDTNIPDISSNTAYFNGNIEVSGNLALQNASLRELQVINNLSSYTATFNHDVTVHGALTSNGTIIQW